MPVPSGPAICDVGWGLRPGVSATGDCQQDKESRERPKRHSHDHCAAMRETDPVVSAVVHIFQAGHHSKRAPIRRMRGPVMAIGLSQEAPELVVTVCSALVLNRL